jgi:hypothetical protein
MHDKLLDHQDALTPPGLRRYASELGLDTDRFTDDLHHHRLRRPHPRRRRQRRRQRRRPARRASSSNGKRYEGAYDLATLTATVGAARTRAAAALLREPAPPGLRAA